VKLAWLLLAGAAGCATPSQGPFFGDEAYLHFGLDTQAEAKALIQTYADQSEPLALRLEGQHFTALGFMDKSGRATRVRVLTVRGIQLALDLEPATAWAPQTQYALLDAPIAGTQDADGDGFEDVFVERRTADATCLLMYHVLDVGFVDALASSVRLFGREWCATGMTDLDHDGRTELTVDIELFDFPGVTPRVRVPLWQLEHRYPLRAKPDALARYVTAERATRAHELADARRHVDATSVERLAIELAALAHVLGESAQNQLASFDGALAGMVLNASEQQAVLEARRTIFKTWNDSPAADQADTSRQPHD
jgi:hypothetical protein